MQPACTRVPRCVSGWMVPGMGRKTRQEDGGCTPFAGLDASPAKFAGTEKAGAPAPVFPAVSVVAVGLCDQRDREYPKGRKDQREICHFACAHHNLP